MMTLYEVSRFCFSRLYPSKQKLFNGCATQTQLKSPKLDQSLISFRKLLLKELVSTGEVIESLLPTASLSSPMNLPSDGLRISAKRKRESYCSKCICSHNNVLAYNIGSISKVSTWDGIRIASPCRSEHCLYPYWIIYYLPLQDSSTIDLSKSIDSVSRIDNDEHDRTEIFPILEAFFSESTNSSTTTSNSSNDDDNRYDDTTFADISSSDIAKLVKNWN